jgi:hypothetical protein
MASERTVGDNVELLSTVLLALATLASAWCAYQATLWSGEQARALAESNANQFESLRLNGRANLKQIVDISTYLNYTQSVARGDEAGAALLLRHVRPEFKPLFLEWVGRNRGELRGSERETPFDSPSYEIADQLAAQAHQKESARALAAAGHANDQGDLFVLHTVVIAIALFFLGSAPQIRRRAVRLGAFGFGALVLTLAVISMLRLQRAPAEAAGETARAAGHG